MRIRALAVAALAIAGLVITTGLGSCDYFLMGTYTGLCDEPRTLYGDLGEPEEVRRAQCQVEGNLCCRRRDASGKPGLTADKRTYCLNTWECYLGGPGEPCYGDVDCEPGLACEGGSVKSNQQGQCLCPFSGGVACRTMTGVIYCCAEGSVCGAGSCSPPAPVDMATDPPDLRRPPDLRKTPDGGV